MDMHVEEESHSQPSILLVTVTPPVMVTDRWPGEWGDSQSTHRSMAATQMGWGSLTGGPLNV